MPEYRFHCEDCDNKFMVECKSSEISGKQIKCANCLSLNVHRVYKSPNISTNKIKPTTPMEGSGSKMVTRIPEYVDRNTGKKFLGSPQTIVD